MSDAAPSTKRKRTEEPAPTRSHIWKPFGDIVLQAESTQFRVNRDVLATQSSVFADMFTVPQPPDEPKVEECSVVVLSGDSAQDWELLLQVLYEPFEDKEMRPFKEIAAMLRLGRKYGFTAAEANAVRRIHLEFPTTLGAWDRSSSTGFTKIYYYEGLYLDLLNLAHEFGVNSSIPAIASCSLDVHPLDCILTGMKRPDSSRIVLHPDVEKMLAIGFARMMGFQYTSCSWLDNNDVVTTSSCTDKTECGCGLNELRRWCITNQRFDGPNCFMLSDWPEKLSDHFCDYCAEAAENAFNANRVKVWDALPTFFGLPKWDELKDAE